MEEKEIFVKLVQEHIDSRIANQCFTHSNTLIL